jgi:hypothetical protein
MRFEGILIGIPFMVIGILFIKELTELALVFLMSGEAMLILGIVANEPKYKEARK